MSNKYLWFYLLIKEVIFKKIIKSVRKHSFTQMLTLHFVPRFNLVTFLELIIHKTLIKLVFCDMYAQPEIL